MYQCHLAVAFTQCFAQLKFLLQYHEVDVAVTHDDDWASVIENVSSLSDSLVVDAQTVLLLSLPE